MLKIVRQSHADHALTTRQLVHIIHRFKDRNGFFKESFELPEHLGTATAELYGPAAGDDPVPESEVEYLTRGNRSTKSRMVRRPLRQTRTITVVAGPLGDEPCVLYTAYGGPLAPREPDDDSISFVEEKLEAQKFWSQHALAIKD